MPTSKLDFSTSNIASTVDLAVARTPLALVALVGGLDAAVSARLALRADLAAGGVLVERRPGGRAHVDRGRLEPEEGQRRAEGLEHGSFPTRYPGRLARLAIGSQSGADPP